MTTQSPRLPITFGTTAGGPNIDQSFAIATAAEEAGFTSVGFSDRPHDPIPDGWTLSTAVAARTSKIRVFHVTLNVPYRFPAVLAKEAATLDLISSGRLDLCLGAGGEGNRALYDTIGVPLAEPGERMTDLEDAIAIMRGMWANEKFSYQGRVYHVDGADGRPKPAQGSIPIWIGARMPRSLRMTGRIADGFIKNGGWGSVEELREMNDVIDRSYRKAGRDPNAIRRILNGTGFVGTKDEIEAYRARTPNSPQPGAPWTTGLVGTPDEVIEIVRSYRNEARIDMFNVRFAGADALEQISRFGREVIPAARDM